MKFFRRIDSPYIRKLAELSLACLAMVGIAVDTKKMSHAIGEEISKGTGERAEDISSPPDRFQAGPDEPPRTNLNEPARPVSIEVPSKVGTPTAHQNSE